MAAPQKENGYTPIANEILEAVYAAKLSATQYRILMILWRYTYGYNRKSAPISQSFIAKATDTHISSVRRETTKLVSWGIVHEISPAGFNRAKVLEFNKNYEEWNVTQVAQTLPPSVEARSAQKVPDTGSVDATQERHIKQDIKQKPCVRGYITFFSQNIGVITPSIIQEAESYIEDGMEDDVITLALKEAVDAGAKNWKYAKAILNNWLEKKVLTVEQAKAAQLEFKNRKPRGRPPNVMERSYSEEEKERRKRDAFADMEDLANGI